MKTKLIKLRLELNTYNLRNYINTFFRDTRFNSQFVCMEVKVTTDGGNSSYELGPKTYLDLKNQANVKIYKIRIMNNFMVSTTKSLANDLLTINYRELNKESYDNFVKGL
jgi:hypothetical protein